VARDTLGLFLVVQIIIILLGFFVRACDTNNAIRDLFPASVSDHEKTTYYICGFVLFFAILGFFGLCTVCLTNNTGPVHDPCWGCYGCYFGDCNRSCSGGGSDDGKACLVIIVVLVVVLAFIGIFVGIFLASIFFQRIVQRHVKVLWLKQETKKYRVRDFNGRELPADGERPHDAHNDGPMTALTPLPDSARVALIPSAPEMDSSYHGSKPGYQPAASYPPELYE